MSDNQGTSGHYQDCLKLAVEYLPKWVIRQPDEAIAFDASMGNPSFEDVESLIASALPFANEVPLERRTQLVMNAFKEFGDAHLKGKQPDEVVLAELLGKQRLLYSLCTPTSVE